MIPIGSPTYLLVTPSSWHLFVFFRLFLFALYLICVLRSLRWQVQGVALFYMYFGLILLWR